MRIGKLTKRAILPGAAAMALALPAASLLYNYSGGSACARCHEIQATFDTWGASTHRGVKCQACHGDVLTLDPGFHFGNLGRLVTHLRGQAPEQIRVKNRDFAALLERCRNCHRQEYAAWQAGPHSVTYAEIFLDEKHNRERLLMDDCMRCHGMHFEGGIADLVTPVATAGPWALKDPELAGRPAIPCMTCHQMHREGRPLARARVREREKRPAAAGQEIAPPSLALFDRRELRYVALARLPLPTMKDGARMVKMSPDARQGLCYQCHAPLADFQVGSGDDRTGMGVHEGLSCLACHEKHGQTTRASCAGCHPRLSNCGLDVETMDTTFRSPASPHNIHFVKCEDCHPKGVPKMGTGSNFAAPAKFVPVPILY